MIRDSANNGQSRAPVVMIVDDEQMMTTSLASLLAIDPDVEYEVLTFQSPVEALQRLQKGPVDLVITDFLMPDMDGLQFIAEAQRLYPDLPCILLTGYADKENAIKALNKVSLYQYVEKPWENDQLRIVVRNAIQTKSLKRALWEHVKKLDEVLLERDRLIQDNEMLKEELALARSVQQSLLPANLPRNSCLTITARYEPALEIGGDFYDVVPLAGDKTAVLISDVTGHGIQAALITVLLKSAFLEMKGREVTAGEILASLNNLLFKILPKNLYVAALVVVLDANDSRARLVNAGIPHPMIVHRAQCRIERIAANGLLLGVADAEVYRPAEEVTLLLQPGDTLLLYTDGVSETPNTREEHFETHMLDVLSGLCDLPDAALLDQVLAQCKKFGKPDYPGDDVTMLAISMSRHENEKP